MATKAELKQRLVTGHVITEQDMKDIIDVAGEKGAKGDPGAQGSPGVEGKAGAKGAPGAAGKDGADGFGTEEQYNAIIARLEALEPPAV